MEIVRKIYEFYEIRHFAEFLVELMSNFCRKCFCTTYFYQEVTYLIYKLSLIGFQKGRTITRT